MGNSAGIVQEMVNGDFNVDIETPRGETAKAEVKRLRQLIQDRNQSTMSTLLHAKFRELDENQSGTLENKELQNVVKWVMSSFGSKFGTDPDVVEKKLMLRLDANKDGKLDLDEFQVLFQDMVNRIVLIEKASVKFNELDTDKSGFLESSEIDKVCEWTLSAYPQENYEHYKKKLIERIDNDGDGKISLIEFTNLFEHVIARTSMLQRAKVKFDELDSDKSGFIERSELDKMIDWVLTVYIEKSVEDRTSFHKTFLDRIDVNKDGKLDFLEFLGVYHEMFSRMDMIAKAKSEFQKLDKDNSGFLEAEELKGVIEKWAIATNSSLGVDMQENLSKMIGTVDINADGKLELMESIPLFEKVLIECGFWN